MASKLFIRAVSANDIKTMRDLLLNSYIDQDTLDDSLDRAVSNGNANIVKYLVEHNADVKSYNNISLRIAVHNRNVDIVEILLKAKANVNVINVGTDDSLTSAMLRGETDIVKLILQYKADVNILDPIFVRCYMSIIPENLSFLLNLDASGVDLSSVRTFDYDGYKQAKATLNTYIAEYIGNYVSKIAMSYI